jgi:hypothetical protein
MVCRENYNTQRVRAYAFSNLWVHQAVGMAKPERKNVLLESNKIKIEV